MAKIRGWIDGLVDGRLSGWALDEAAPGRTCLVKVFDEAGTLLARGPASRHRQDLDMLGTGRTNFAFQLRLPRITGAAQLTITADEVPLPNSTFAFGPGLFDGFIVCGDGSLAGSVTERVADASPCTIQLTDQTGRLLFETVAAPARIAEFMIARFRTDLPVWAYENKALSITATANGVAFARCAAMLGLVGYLDVLTSERCAGWLFSPDAVAVRFPIEVFRDGKLVGKGICNLARGDIASRYPCATDCGFDIRLDDVLSMEAAHTWSLRIDGSASELFGGPFLQLGRNSKIGLIRRIGHLAHSLRNAGLSPAATTVLRQMVQQAIDDARGSNRTDLIAATRCQKRRHAGTRLTVIVPVYRDVGLTKACLRQLLKMRDPLRDHVVIVNDRSPEPGMTEMLGVFADQPNTTLLHNEQNVGFRKSVNRALCYSLTGDVLLLNSDTRLFAGALDEMLDILHASADIGTVTAMSNNASIFSYPHPSHRKVSLPDASWESLAAVALQQCRGKSVDVPTAHGFCMLIREDVLHQLGGFDEAYGRGYGEENDFCQRAADHGYRHVAACAVLVEHRESVSFVGDKGPLLAMNLARLEQSYPDYKPAIADFERTDPLRVARRSLDLHRLGQTAGGFLVVVESWLGGGSRKAAQETTRHRLRPGQGAVWVRCTQDGSVTVDVETPWIHACFAAGEVADLMTLLDTARPAAIVIHQFLGFDQDTIRGLAAWLVGKPTTIYLHDFYAICPRVTLINALGEFCAVPEIDVCERCIAIAGPHPAAKMAELTPGEHRAMFARLLDHADTVATPSDDTATWIRRALPSLASKTVPHPDLSPPTARAAGARRENFVLVGALGPHKGSAKLVEIARRARLWQPTLRFHIIGYTDRDSELLAIGNVVITGAYEPANLAELIRVADAQAALFLHVWPETFSYTFTEVVGLGLLPIVPDIGAPAERVRALGHGIIYPFPSSAERVLETLVDFVLER